MNFLLRHSSSSVAVAAVDQHAAAIPPLRRRPSKSLEGLIFDDKLPLVDYLTGEHRESFESDSGASTSSQYVSLDGNHVDVKDDEGWIVIPSKELPDNWSDAPDMQWFRTLGRSFVFPGEQVHIVACISTSEQETEIITPFKVAALTNKIGIGQGAKNPNGSVVSLSETQPAGHDDHIGTKIESGRLVDVSAGESLLRMEGHRRRNETLLQSFRHSHFFVRIAESEEEPGSKRSSIDAFEIVSDIDSVEEKTNRLTSINAVIDRGRFDSRVSGGLARNSVKCCALSNGDILGTSIFCFSLKVATQTCFSAQMMQVLLQMNVGFDSLNDPILEILQFEDLNNRNTTLETDLLTSVKPSPFDDLLKWMHPLDNPHHPSKRPPNPSLVNASRKPSFSPASGSQLFSFGHFRSYSMSSLPQNDVPQASPPVPVSTLKPNSDPEDWDHFSLPEFGKAKKIGCQGLMSFRGISLVPGRFSACCGLEGIFVPGRRWRKRLEIIQPVDIQTFATSCNTDDLICVQIKNVSPAHISDMVVYIDSITIVLDEVSKAGPPLVVPIACIESGSDHSLPNFALRREEEHCFILKPAISALKRSTTHDKKTKSRLSKAGSKAASMQLSVKDVEGTWNLSSSDKYAVLVTCRSNHSESRLFFKKSIDWRPCVTRDIMISVASEISKQTKDLTGRVCQLPVQVLTLQASNLSSEDVTLTILAPASVTSTPSLLSLNSQSSSPASPFKGFATTQKASKIPGFKENQIQNAQPPVPVADVIPTTALSRTHLWLQSGVPLGHVPPYSTATIKLELLPLTDGIITLDTLRIDVKEKGQTYIPDHPLKINVTSSVDWINLGYELL